MFDQSDMLFAHDLKGCEVTVEIEKVWAGELTGEAGRKSKKPFVKFKDHEKRLAINKTNGKTLKKLYGADTDRWIGKLVTLYPTTTNFGGETVDCIRIKPHVPTPVAKGSGKAPASSPPATRPPSGTPLTEEEMREIAAAEARGNG